MGLDCQYSSRCDGTCPEKDIKECGVWYHFRFPDAEVESDARNRVLQEQAAKEQLAFCRVASSFRPRPQEQPQITRPRIAA